MTFSDGYPSGQHGAYSPRSDLCCRVIVRRPMHRKIGIHVGSVALYQNLGSTEGTFTPYAYIRYFVILPRPAPKFSQRSMKRNNGEIGERKQVPTRTVDNPSFLLKATKDHQTTAGGHLTEDIILGFAATQPTGSACVVVIVW